jgi:acetoin utilization protein AcuB
LRDHGNDPARAVQALGGTGGAQAFSTSPAFDEAGVGRARAGEALALRRCMDSTPKHEHAAAKPPAVPANPDDTPRSGPPRPIREFMTEAPHSIGADQTLSTAHEMMRRHRIRHLPVLRAGKLVGLLSQRDLYLVETLPDVDPDRVTVEEAMSQHVSSVAPATSLERVAVMMADRKHGCVVVMEDEDVIGIFTSTDALRALADLSRGRDTGWMACVTEANGDTPADPRSVREIMQYAHAVTSPAESVGRALEKMRLFHTNHLIVVRGEEVVGMVDDRALMTTRASSRKPAQVREVMRRTVGVVDATAAAASAERLLRVGHIDAVAVVHRGTVLGTVVAAAPDPAAPARKRRARRPAAGRKAND